MPLTKKSTVAVVIFLVLISTTSQWPVDDIGCRTPNRGVGKCIRANQCKSMIDFVVANAPLPPHAAAFLQGFQCGVEGGSIKICCPDEPIQLNLNKPPDISHHPNRDRLPYECGLYTSSNKIFGGKKTGLYEFPWMALLSYETSTGIDFRCGGTVINDWYILTAAHCITQLKDLKLIGVRVGEHNIDTKSDCEQHPFGGEWCAPPVQDLRIAEIIPHPNYVSASFTNDIGLLRVENRINTAIESVKPICLPATAAVMEIDFTAFKLTVTGWGRTEEGIRSPDLLMVDIPVVVQKNCQEAYAKSSALITHRQICAGGQNFSDSCTGDSGGPLQRLQVYNEDSRYIQFGVVSFGPKPCGKPGYPGVYTRVEHYMHWILDNIQYYTEPDVN